MTEEERSSGLYIVKCDVEHSYDTLSQHKVVELVDELVQEKSYLVKQFSQIRQRDAGHFAHTRCQEGMTATCFTQFQRSVETRQDGSVFVDEMQFHKESGAEVKAAIRKHVTESLIKCGKKLYRQSRGIAQGSVVSVLLCSLAYASLEKHILTNGNSDSGERAHTSKTLLMHFVDDFLLVTTEKSVAIAFIQKTHNDGLPDYGCWMNPAKTQLTFELGGFHHSEQVSWCGRVVTKDLKFMTDYSRYYHKSKTNTHTYIFLEHTSFFSPLMLILSAFFF